jgi:hypothetical protein
VHWSQSHTSDMLQFCTWLDSEAGAAELNLILLNINCTASNNKQTIGSSFAVQIIEKAGAAELNYVLLNINCAAFLEVAMPETLHMLMQPSERLSDLNILSRCKTTRCHPCKKGLNVQLLMHCCSSHHAS